MYKHPIHTSRVTQGKILILTLALLLLGGAVRAQRYMEYLDRGMVGVKTSNSSSFISWRLLASDEFDTPFHLYRQYAGELKVRLTQGPLVTSTCFEDKDLDPGKSATYILTRVVGEQEVTECQILIKPQAPVQPYFEIPMNTPEGYSPGDMSVGDLDGDGSYELIVHQTGNAHDNSHVGLTDNAIFQAYRLDGTMLWEIDLGVNIREGAHYTQFMVYDLDSDGKAEFVCKTSDGTRDGQGRVIGEAAADYRVLDSSSRHYGHILEGPEYLTVFDGLTGGAVSSVDYLPQRGALSSWGDNNANRSERYLAGIAYLDGIHPSLVMTRGYYERTSLAAWDYKDKKLVSRWVFDTKSGEHPYAGQGFHSLAVADVDSDGKDEIIFGAMCIDDDGTGLYSTGLGHGDALHVSDLDPDRAGLEVFGIHELKGGKKGVGASLTDAKTGDMLFQGAIDQDVARGVAANIDPNHRGAYMWWLGSKLYDMQGEIVGAAPRQANFLIWWDGDLSRELLDHQSISKFKQGVIFQAEGATSNNGTKRTPALSADILGDWREELILRQADNRAIRIYTTSIPTKHRLYTLMHDPVYRLGVAWQNVAYNQPPHTGYYLGTGMDEPKINENIRIVDARKNSAVQSPKPLYRDPVYDGAADPVVVWNKALKRWFMFYTNRRANKDGLTGVAWAHGTAIGIATSPDGVSWTYLDTAKFDGPDKMETLWAPEVIEHDGVYHMYLTIVPGVFDDWNHPRHIAHFSSNDLLSWNYESTLALANNKVIDAAVKALPGGGWRMWYNNEKDGKSVYYADSDDLYHWHDKGKALQTRGEGPKVFAWKDFYWMVVDTWKGLAIYRSQDMNDWTRQTELILSDPGTGRDDQVIGGHADVLVVGEQAYIYYFTHPGRRADNKDKDSYEQRRSSIQIAALSFDNGVIRCDRNQTVPAFSRTDVQKHTARYTTTVFP
ncbi:hypothetical protein [Sphingobacterium sp. JB170]|uniref:rhamnogalacturonan lyase family protein n=1 Tax=Sphingobacterium sp. JB170 TaxID=1434842 RepID=UPI00097F42D8|nr:hypothetical protein [Sphingobacterium sp. JB170]SJN34428.1 Predicted rhamnogalacturonan lyase in rhamnose utilization cluster [Sphingobacterium sp. JB170]